MEKTDELVIYDRPSPRLRTSIGLTSVSRLDDSFRCRTKWVVKPGQQYRIPVYKYRFPDGSTGWVSFDV